MKLRNLLLPSLLAASMLVTACESVTHENLDKWANTQKGPGKLMDALKSNEESAEIRAHAAQVLIYLERFADVKEVLAEIDDDKRHKIVAELTERLWTIARVNKELDIPTRNQSNAKDAIFYTMEFADSATKEKMADYVIEWFVGGLYEARAKSGRVSGALAIREIGGQAGKRLLNSTKAIVNTPPDAAGKRTRVKDELLQALAISGDKEVLLYLMDLVEHPRGDNTLPARVIDALYFAFVEPTGIKPVDGGFLKPISDRVSLLLYDTSLSSTARNDSTALLVALGPPDCIPYFTKMIGFAEDPTKYRWMGVQKGIRCAKLQGMQAIIEALAPETGYERGLLDKYLWDEILKLGELPKVASAAEQLLKSDSWVARITGIEVLARVGDSSNVDSIKALSGDKARLKNWWGDQASLPKGERKPIPTIGELAANVAQKLASGTKAK